MQIRASKIYIPASSDASVSATLANSTGLARVPSMSGAVPAFTQAFYVSPSGNDSAAGTSPATAWLTVNRAVQANWVAGAALLFERGGTYQINTINKTITAAGGARFTIGSYGSGALPIMSHWKICNNPNSWVLHSTGIWKIQLGLASTHTGMTETPTGVAFGNESRTNIGHISTDGVIRGAKKTSIAACTAQWDFFGDTTGDWFYIRSSANPTSLVSDFRAAPDGRLIHLRTNLEITDLEFQGCGGVVFSGSASAPANNVRILRNTIRNVGGSFLIGYGSAPYTTRWGDAVETWGGASNYVIDGNTIIGSFDPAIIMAQGTGNISNITASNNNISFSCCAFELSIKNGNWDSIIMENNVCTDIGLGGWASPLQPNQDRNSGIIFMDMDPAHGSSTNIIVRNNLFDRCSRYIFTWPIYDPPLPAGVSFTNNDIRLASGREMQFTKETINNAAAYRTRTGREAGSTFTVL